MASRTFTAATGHGSNVGGDNTLKMQLLRLSDGQIWDAVGLNLEVFILAQVTRYDISVTETASGSGIYVYTIPPTLPAPGNYFERPRYTDTGFLTSREPFRWDGVASDDLPDAGSSAPGFITVAAARSIIREYARNAKSSTMYSNDKIDWAVMHIGQYVRNVTGYGRRHDTVTIPDGDSYVDFTTITGFSSRLLRRCWIVGQKEDVQIVKYADVKRHQVVGAGYADSPYYILGSNSSAMGLIQEIAFVTETSAQVWPQQSADVTLDLLWQPLFTTWDPASDITGITLNLPSDYIIGALIFGAPSVIQANEPENAAGALAGNARFREFIQSIKSGDELGAQSFESYRGRV